MAGWIDGLMAGWIDDWMAGCGWLYGWLYGWIGGWMGAAGEEVTRVDLLSDSEESKSGKECSSSGEYETDSSKKERSREKDEEEVGIEWLLSSSYETY